MIRITPDKWKHFYVGIVLGTVVYGVAILYWPQQPVTALIVSFAILVVLCYGFELFSLITGKGHYELLDAIAGIIGGCLGTGCILLLKILFF